MYMCVCVCVCMYVCVCSSWEGEKLWMKFEDYKDLSALQRLKFAETRQSSIMSKILKQHTPAGIYTYTYMYVNKCTCVCMCVCMCVCVYDDRLVCVVFLYAFFYLERRNP